MLSTTGESGAAAGDGMELVASEMNTGAVTVEESILEGATDGNTVGGGTVIVTMTGMKEGVIVGVVDGDTEGSAPFTISTGDCVGFKDGI